MSCYLVLLLLQGLIQHPDAEPQVSMLSYNTRGMRMYYEEVRSLKQKGITIQQQERNCSV
jgi:hypothetical protein